MSRSVKLNGLVLKMVDDQTLPELQGVPLHTGDPLSLPGFSFAFYVLSQAQAAACHWAFDSHTHDVTGTVNCIHTVFLSRERLYDVCHLSMHCELAKDNRKIFCIIINDTFLYTKLMCHSHFGAYPQFWQRPALMGSSSHLPKLKLFKTPSCFCQSNFIPVMQMMKRCLHFLLYVSIKLTIGQC